MRRLLDNPWYVRLMVYCAIILLALLAGQVIRSAYARDLDGKYIASPLHDWFNGLKSGKGMCCSFADGRTVTDADWEMKADHYIVKVDDNWYDVPSEAIVDVPNKFGQAVVWPYVDSNGLTQIRCFLPGAGT